MNHGFRKTEILTEPSSFFVLSCDLRTQNYRSHIKFNVAPSLDKLLKLLSSRSTSKESLSHYSLSWSESWSKLSGALKDLTENVEKSTRDEWTDCFSLSHNI